MMKKLLPALGLSLLMPMLALAEQEALSIRIDGIGSVQAIVSGSMVDECGWQVYEPSQVSVSAGHVSIMSPDWPVLPCYTPIDPPEPYSRTAQVGVLTPGAYTLTWSQGEHWQLTAGFVVPETPRAVPTISAASMLILIFAVALLAFWASAARRRFRTVRE